MLLILTILTVGCGKQDDGQQIVDTKEKNSSPNNTPEIVSNPVKELNVESLFDLQYCNYTIANRDYDVTKALKELQDAENDIAEAEDDLQKAQEEEDENDIDMLQKKIDTEKANVRRIIATIETRKQELADVMRKCNKLEKGKDSNICKEFIEDADEQVARTQAELEDQNTDVATALQLNQQDRLVREKRKQIQAQVAFDKMHAISQELKQKCGAK